MRSILGYLKVINPVNILKVKRIVDAFEALIRLIEETFGDPREKNNDK